MTAFNKLRNQYRHNLRPGLSLLKKGFTQAISRSPFLLRFRKPNVLQLQITELCNSKCVMCNVWKIKPHDEIKVDSLKKILSDDFFINIRSVGINGGEPTLRGDLVDIAQSLVDTLPNLKATTLLTNAVHAKKVIDAITLLNSLFVSNNIIFSVSLSLDGIDDVHDRHRGRPGNFTSVMRVIDFLQQQRIHFGIGCTITSLNCHYADDVLFLCNKFGISSYEFRMAVPINRLYNHELFSDLIFSDKQHFHTAMFIEKLAHSNSLSEWDRANYMSLFNQFEHNDKRKVTCDWALLKGITLDSQGQISFCSVNSQVFPFSDKKSVSNIVTQNLPMLKAIIKTKCHDCWHFKGDELPINLIRKGLNKIYSPLKHVTSQKKQSNIPKITIHIEDIPADVCNWSSVVITGWYGTETAGDKAILGELINFIGRNNSNCKFVITSIHPYITRQTIKELGAENSASVIEINTVECRVAAKKADAVIIGGGPLMDIPEMEFLFDLFKIAYENKRERIIFGCGIDPYLSDTTKSITSALCQMATSGFFRDEESRKIAMFLNGNKKLSVACDPAFGYVTRWSKINTVQHEQQYCSLLREMPSIMAFRGDHSELKTLNAEFADTMAKVFDYVHSVYSMPISLLPMHCYWHGGDDRYFNRSISDKCNAKTTVQLSREYLTLDELIKLVSNANGGVAMRYHGHIFLASLGIPFISIDYTGKGKVGSLLNALDWGSKSIPWSKVSTTTLVPLIEDLLLNSTCYKEHLLENVNQQLHRLHTAYGTTFKTR